MSGETRLSGLVNPQALADMVVEGLPNNAEIIPGVFTTDDFPNALGQKGTLWEIPYDKPLGAMQKFIPGTPLSNSQLLQDKYRMVVNSMASMYTADKLARSLSAKDPYASLVPRLQDLIKQTLMAAQIVILEGAIPSANRHSVAATTTGAAVAAAAAKRGDKAHKLTYALMHSKQYWDAIVAKEIVFQPRTAMLPIMGDQVQFIGQQYGAGDLVATISGLIVVVSDNCTVVSGSPDTYAMYLLSQAAMGMFWKQNLNIDVGRVINLKEDVLSPDFDFVMCLHGVDYTSTSYADAELAKTSNYTLKWDHKLVGAVRLLTR
jgi:hypothetical protein